MSEGQVRVLLRRLDVLKAALDAQPHRTDDVEFAFDQVLRAALKMEQTEKSRWRPA
jgi:hypothetical protein